ncbi:MAG TPA: adenylate/guanylate cyclase domain-containing protein [Candidatus Cybelea sp.]|nr:adenylate/guanylate cyclase domain-containing protein [Candidatus Cybelea sp.]
MTLLFSDIEGSTARWEQNREAMGAALARHDRLLRAALEAHGAYIFKTMGDAFCAAFATASDALAAALESQRALAAEDFAAVAGIRVRMALHAGQTEERDDDYFGPAVNRVARLLAIGHGGQVLISGACAEMLEGRMAPGCTLRDLGVHRLKDIDRPEHVYQLVAAGLEDEFSQLRSLEHLSNNLPAPLNALVGREQVVGEVCALLESRRIVTLVGAGGSGKTRCAISVGQRLLDQCDDGVWLVELASLSEPSLVIATVARHFGIAESPSRPLLDMLLSYLKRKRLLLVLDNCEHLIDETRALARSLLHAAPQVRILATSREALNLAGEQIYRIPSLSPAAAAQLFVERASAVNPRFEATAENAPQIEEICARLDGIPLAIELAAARVKVLSPQRLLQMLDERFRLLTGGDRSALPRHQTMRALIDWSYDLLDEREQSLFRKLSVFAGGFRFEDAATAFHDGVTDDIAILDVLSSLVDKSLVQAEPDERYRMLESTREYARERLVALGEEQAASRAHAAAFLTLAQDFDDMWETTADRAWSERGERELENFRAALAWSFGSAGDVALGQRLASTFVSMWGSFGEAEADRWVERGIALVDERTPPSLIANLELAHARLVVGFAEAGAGRAAAERALERYRALGDAVRAGHAQRIVGFALVVEGNVAGGSAILEEALRTAKSAKAHRLAILALLGVALAREVAGDGDRARQLYAEALDIAEVLGAERQGAGIRCNLAETLFRCGDVAEALELVEVACDTYRTLGLPTCKAVINVAAYAIALDRFDEAREAARAALTDALDLQYRVVAVLALQHLAAIAALEPNAGTDGAAARVRAARILGFVDARLAALNVARDFTERQEYDRLSARLREELDEDAARKHGEEGRAWNEDRAVAEAMAV